LHLLAELGANATDVRWIDDGLEDREALKGAITSVWPCSASRRVTAIAGGTPPPQSL
jgi:hypothetical protein